METKEYTTIDRAALGWPSGKWDGEPDKAQWPDAETGLPCLAVRNSYFGFWCGYVGVTQDHPMFGKDYNAFDEFPEVHWGVNYSNSCDPSASEEIGICHVPGAGESDHVWWFGFDCAQSGDSSPIDAKRGDMNGYGSYRTLDYVRHHVRKLAEQLKAMQE